MDINFELYKIFYYAATSGSFSAAAGKLYISQSAISQAMKNLETKMGVQLFRRQTRLLKLTREGELLLTHVEQAFNFLKVAESKIIEMQNLETGTIRIGASDTVCKYYLLTHLERFNRRYPRIKIQFFNRNSPQIITALKSGAVDFGIITLPIAAENMNVRELTMATDIFVAGDKFTTLKGLKIPLLDLAHYPLLLLDKNSATRRNFDSFIKELGIDIIPEIELESVDLLVELAKIGLGIAHVLRDSALSSIAKGELFEVDTLEKLPSRQLGIVTNENVPLSQAVKKFIELLH